MTDLDGAVRISRISSNRDHSDSIRIVIADVRAGIHIAEAILSITQLGDILTGREAECKVLVDDSGRVGTVREVKEEGVPLPERFYSLSDDDVAALLRPYEVDGWIGRAGDVKNSHRHSRTGAGECASVVFERWVEQS